MRRGLARRVIPRNGPLIADVVGAWSWPSFMLPALVLRKDGLDVQLLHALTAITKLRHARITCAYRLLTLGGDKLLGVVAVEWRR